MLFTSISFLFYFLPVVILLYYVCSFSITVQNVLLLACSLLFYAWGDINNISLLLILIVFNYVIARWIKSLKLQKPCIAKWVLFSSIGVNASFLLFYKYINFAFENISQLSNVSLPSFTLAIPLGISFFTLQIISYLVDSYYNRCKTEKNIFHFALFVSFFPQITTGPILRYHDLENQFISRKVSFTQISLGAMRFITGLSKKVLIANMLSYPTDLIFAWNNHEALPILLAWLGAILFMVQLYYDFSGYSDMAIGLGLMFGFVFEENFNYPYIAKSVSAFWRRWHITLSLWFRDYIYIPLGGSRVKNQDTMVRNLLVVWTVTGIWHGANWNYLLWGWYFFLFIFLEKLIHFENKEWQSKWRHVYLLVVVCIGFVLFRCESLPAISNYLSSMLGFRGLQFEDMRIFMILQEYGIILLIGVIFCVPIARKVNYQIMINEGSRLQYLFGIGYPIVMVSLLIICMIFVVKGSHNPFLYGQF